MINEVNDMTEKDLDVAIEKCERIMEFDTRTMQNPVSENGYIFEKVYELLKFLRQFQFDTDTNVVGNLIDRQAALDAIKKLEKPAPTAQHLSAIFDCEDTIKALPSAQPSVSKTEIVGDAVSRQAAIETVRKAQSIGQAHRMLIQLPSAQPTCTVFVPVDDCISRQATIAEIMEDLEDRSLHDDPATPEDYAEGYDEGIRNAAAIVLQMPSAQPGWIPVTERLPEKDGEYLVTIDWGDGDTEVDCYDYCANDTDWNDGDLFGVKVLAWMPLPKPWKNE